MIFPQGREVLFGLVVATGVLLSLAVLLAATTLVLRAENALAARRWARMERTWTPLLLEVLAGDRGPLSVLTRVPESERLLFADFLVEFARRVKGEELELVRAMAGPMLDAVAARVTRGSAERRARAVQTIGDLGTARHVWALVAALDDPSSLVAMTAARALARRKEPEHLAAVVARLHRFEEWSYGFLAATLGAFGPAAAPTLRETLADARQRAPTRVVAAETLRLLNDLAAATAAAEAVATSADADLVAAALRLIAAVGTAEHLPVVRSACESGDPAVRAQACAALGALGDAEDRERLRAALADPSPWVVLRAAHGLKALGGADALAASLPWDAPASRALAE